MLIARKVNARRQSSTAMRGRLTGLQTLLSGPLNRKFAPADPLRQAFGECCYRLFAVGFDKLFEGSKKRSLGKAIALDPVHLPFRKRFAYISKRSLALRGGEFGIVAVKFLMLNHSNAFNPRPIDATVAH